MYDTEDTCYVKLRELAANVKKGVIVEVGAKKGQSAHCMASVANVPVYSIDLWDLTHQAENRPEIHMAVNNRLAYNKRTRGLDVIPVKGLSAEIGKVWNRKIGLLFIDGDHSYEGARADYRAFAPHILIGGWLVIHDYIPKSKRYAGVERLINEIKDDPQWTGWGVTGRTIFARRKRK